MAPQNSQKATARPSLDNEPARPGTSGTEMMLTNNRRRASNRLRDAEKKEREYRNNKRSTTARANFSEAKSHFKQGLHHNWTAVKLMFGVVKSVGYIVRDKKDRASRRSDEKRKVRAAEKQRKLEEKLKRDKELMERSSGDGETIRDEK